jgi:hypothetical protein
MRALLKGNFFYSLAHETNQIQIIPNTSLQAYIGNGGYNSREDTGSSN